MAYAQVGVYGMNEKIGLVSFPQEENQFSKPYSNETAQLIDSEVRSMVGNAYRRTLDLLTEKKDLVRSLAERLLEQEVPFPAQHDNIYLLAYRHMHRDAYPLVTRHLLGQALHLCTMCILTVAGWRTDSCPQRQAIGKY